MKITTSKPMRKPTEVSEREYDSFVLTLMHYENNEYKSSIQLEFSDEARMRDHVETVYDLDKKWRRKADGNEYWYFQKTPKKILHTHVVVMQQIRKHEKTTKVLMDDNILF